MRGQDFEAGHTESMTVQVMTLYYEWYGSLSDKSQREDALGVGQSQEDSAAKPKRLGKGVERWEPLFQNQN